MGRNGWRIGMALLLAAGFIAPLAWTQELGYWHSDAPVSHLVWDEAQASPGEVAPHRPADARGVSAGLLAGLAVASALAAAILAGLAVGASRGSPPR